MNTEIPAEQVPDLQARASAPQGQAANPDPERLQRTVQRFLGGFHAGLLDTGFMAFDDPALEMTMSG
jgi:hypothetical protein